MHNGMRQSRRTTISMQKISNPSPLKLWLESKNRTRKMDKTGHVVESHPNTQYRIRMDGSGRLTLRNRKFIREDTTQAKRETPSPHISPLNTNVPQTHAKVDTAVPRTTLTREELTDQVVETSNAHPIVPSRNNIRQLKRLQDFNEAGLGETPGRPSRRLRSGKDF